MSDINMDSIINKIRRLLALTASPNQAEAEAAMAKAHELLLKYNLEMNDIGVEKSDIIEKEYMKGNKIRTWKAQLITGVSRFNFCAIYYNRQYDPDDDRAYYTKRNKLYTYKIVGREHNLMASMVMIEYLIETIDRMAKRIEREHRESYKNGMVDILNYRLEKIRNEEMASSNKCTDLIIVEDKDVQAYMDKLKLIEEKKKVPVISNNGYERGVIDGRDISLNAQVKKEIIVAGFIEE
jgi:hypothetical protein